MHGVLICLIYGICVGVFYYVIGNIEPKLRSSLRCIQLIACVTAVNLEKYGYDMVLKPFIQDANKLSKVGILILNRIRDIIGCVRLFT